MASGGHAETGEMEWHAADGSVISESDWQPRAAAASRPRRGRAVPAEEGVDEAPPPGWTRARDAESCRRRRRPAEGSASDEATRREEAKQKRDEECGRLARIAKRTPGPPAENVDDD